MSRYFLFLLGMILALPVLAIVALALGLPITGWGIGYLAGAALVAAGLILAPWTGRRWIWITSSGLILMALVAGLRLIRVSGQSNPAIRVIALPQGKPSRGINSLIDEQDSLIVGEALFHQIGGDSPNEHEGLTSSLRADYAEIKGAQAVFPSPFVSTYLGLQTPTHFDAVVIPPRNHSSPEFALIFLHGYMGNVTAQCWEIAQALKDLPAVTVCPSTSWRGDWWQPQGQGILDATLAYVRKQGIQKIYLGGFSNGGISIGRLALQLKRQEGLTGLIFVDGFDNGAAVRETGLPVFILQGAQDERIPPAAARGFAEEVGERGTYVEIDGDHFLIMKEPDSVQNAIQEWLQGQETGP